MNTNGISPRASPSFTVSYYVDLPIGTYLFKDVLNLCCISNPSKGFMIERRSGKEIISALSFNYRNPLAPPRAGALNFWEINNGMAKSTNGIPDDSELSAALSSANPGKRWTSRVFLEATHMNYSWTGLLKSADSAEAKVWVGIGIKAAFLRGIDAPRFFAANLGPAFETNVAQIKDPSLALIMSLELAKEKQEDRRLDKIVRDHEFSIEEINNIEPDIYRLFNESKLVRAKLKTLQLETPQFSPKSSGELERHFKIQDAVGPFFTAPPENLFEVLSGNAN